MAELNDAHLKILSTLIDHDGSAQSAELGSGASDVMPWMADQGLIQITGRTVTISDVGRNAIQPSQDASRAFRQPRHGTKLAGLVRRLTTKRGRTIAELAEAMDWLPHTTRAALTRLRRSGYTVLRLPPVGKSKLSRYRIAPETER